MLDFNAVNNLQSNKRRSQEEVRRRDVRNQTRFIQKYFIVTEIDPSIQV